MDYYKHNIMKNFLKLLDGALVNPLLLAIHRFDKSRGDIWKEDTYLRDYPQGPFGDTESVILRFPPRSVLETKEELKNHLSTFDQHENVDQDIFKLLPEARLLIFGLMALVQGERLGRCIINKLKPGGKIYRHADTKDHAEYWDRFHIVLQSEPGSMFYCDDEQVMMQTGEIWWFNNALEHEVINNSSEDRIHLVVDIRTSK
jgi:hypothetical protein